MFKRIPLNLKLVFIALLLGVLIPYGSFLLRFNDSCMPEHAGLAYFPLISPLAELCPLAFMGELGLLSVGLPCVLAAVAIVLVISAPTQITAYLSSGINGGWFCIPPLIGSFLFYLIAASLLPRRKPLPPNED